jgi:hypothetical protein
MYGVLPSVNGVWWQQQCCHCDDWVAIQHLRPYRLILQGTVKSLDIRGYFVINVITADLFL